MSTGDKREELSRWRWYLRLRLQVLVLSLGCLSSDVALAGGVVRECTASALRTAMAGGGLVTFACSGTITLTETLDIGTDTVLEGSGQTVALSGGGAVRVLVVRDGVSLEVRNLILTQGKHSGSMDTATPGEAGGSGGAILLEGPHSRLRAEGCVMGQNLALGGYSSAEGGTGGAGLGGAVRVRGGQAEFVDCRFEGNRVLGGPESRQPSLMVSANGPGLGGAIYADEASILRLVRCRFQGNLAAGGGNMNSLRGRGGDAMGGAVYCAGGTLEIRECRFEGNSLAPGTARRNSPAGLAAGGALYLHTAMSSALVYDSLFEGNLAKGGSAVLGSQPVAGGAIYSAGALRCELTRFVKNRSEHDFVAAATGGAIAGAGDLWLQDSTFTENVVRGGVGGGPAGENGYPGSGGAVYLGGLGTIVGCTFDGNQAVGGDGNSIAGQRLSHGGPGRGGAVYVEIAAGMTNCTFYRNEARGGSANTFYDFVPGDGQGGAIWVGRDFEGVHLTLMENQAVRSGVTNRPGSGGGIYLGTSANAKLANSVVADSTWGNNCSRAFENSTRCLSSDGSCGFVGGSGWDKTPPKLGPFTIEAGPTATFIPVEGSLAIDGGDPLKCPPTDQRGVARPASAACDVGAYELARTGSVKGRVRGLPTQVQAQVRAGRTFGLTDVDGSYVILSVPAGPSDLSLAADGYRFLPGSVRLEFGEATVVQDFQAYPVNTLLVERAAGTAWRFRFGTVESTRWILERSTDLSQWTPVTTNRAGTSGWVEAEWGDGTSAGELGYFRMRRP